MKAVSRENTWRGLDVMTLEALEQDELIGCFI